MIVVLATFEMKPGTNSQMHIPMNSVEIEKLPLTKKDEEMILKTLEKEYSPYVPLSIDAVTWQPDI